MVTVFIIVIGLVIGSFLNAVIFRLHSGRSFIFGHSECVHCHHVLKPWDLIPVLSFIFLRGRCRYCGKKISWQYPLIELITMIVFVLINSRFQIPDSKFLFAAVFSCFLIVIAVFDFKHFLILDKVVLPAFILAVIFRINNHFLDGLLAALIIAGFFGLQYVISKGRWIGFGDVKLGAFLGMLFGVKSGIVMLMIAYCLGAAVGLILIMLDKKNLSSKMPFGTFLSVSAIIVLLYGDQIVNWYFKLIGL